MGVQYNAPQAVPPPHVECRDRRHTHCDVSLRSADAAWMHHGSRRNCRRATEPTTTRRTATIVPEPKKKPKRQEARGQPRYNVILWDSDDHTYDYVERMLRELFGHTQEECHKMAETVDTQGKVDRADDDQGARRAEARPDPRLRQGRAHQELQGLDARHDRIGGLAERHGSSRIVLDSETHHETANRHARLQGQPVRNRVRARRACSASAIEDAAEDEARRAVHRQHLHGDGRRRLQEPAGDSPAGAARIPARRSS